MDSHSGNNSAPAGTQPVPAQRPSDVGPEDVAPSLAQACEFEPQVSQVPPGRLLFLDDDPQRAICFLNRHPDTVWVLTAKECIARLAEGWDQVHLDHDLGGEVYVDPLREDCGMEVVRWLCTSEQKQLRETWFIIHSHNSEAASEMVKHLRENGYRAVYRPFGVELLDRLREPQPQSPTAAPACRLPHPSGDCGQPRATVAPSSGTCSAARLGALFRQLGQILARRQLPGRGSSSDHQTSRGVQDHAASRKAGSES